MEENEEKKDVIRLVKHDAVELDDGDILYIMEFYTKGKFNRCAVKVDTPENWKTLIEGLSLSDPAMNFRMSDIGLKAPDSNVIYSHGHIMTRFSVKNLLKLKFSPKNLRKPTDFVNEEFYLMGNVTCPYLRKYTLGDETYDILDLISMPKGVWMTEDYKRCNGHHRKARIIQ